VSVYIYLYLPISNDQILYLKQVKDEPPRIRRRILTFGFVHYLNGKTAKCRICVQVRLGRFLVRAVYKRTLTHNATKSSI